MYIRKVRYGLYSFLPLEGNKQEEWFYSLLLRYCKPNQKTKLHFVGYDHTEPRRIYFEIPGFNPEYRIDTVIKGDRKELSIVETGTGNLRLDEVYSIIKVRHINPALLSLLPMPQMGAWKQNDLKFQIGFLTKCSRCYSELTLISEFEFEVICAECEEQEMRK